MFDFTKLMFPGRKNNIPVPYKQKCFLAFVAYYCQNEYFRKKVVIFIHLLKNKYFIVKVDQVWDTIY